MSQTQCKIMVRTELVAIDVTGDSEKEIAKLSLVGQADLCVPLSDGAEMAIRHVGNDMASNADLNAKDLLTDFKRRNDAKVTIGG